MARKYDLVIFDFDGTLADTFPWFVSVMNSAADRFGFKRVEPNQVQVLREYGPQAILTELGLPLWKVPMVAQHFRSLMTQQLHSVSLFEGSGALLQSLVAKGVTLALVTSNSERNVRQLLGPSNAGCFTHFACGSSMFGKAAKVKKIRARSQIPSGKTLLIGDEVRDFEAARASGVGFGAVSWGYNTGTALRACGPTEYFETMDDIRQLF